VGLNHRPTVYETVALPLSYIGFRIQPGGTQGCPNGLATVNHTIILGVARGGKKNVAGSRVHLPKTGSRLWQYAPDTADIKFDDVVAPAQDATARTHKY
jgi:hypothetical protein